QIRRLRNLPQGAELEFRLREGKNRQIRRMCLHMNWSVTCLQRIQLGPIKLGDLALGQYRSLQSAEIRALRLAAGLN
ncbi:MAG: pseudouridine synthase, partial [Candidatus Melainabacteria bacterium HGW-Melainabacteria-1]